MDDLLRLEYLSVRTHVGYALIGDGQLVHELTHSSIPIKRAKIFLSSTVGPKWLPIVGNTFELRRQAKKYGSQTEVFRAWQKQYNSNVIGLKMGSELMVVALTYPIVHEVHINDAFDGRPDNFFLRLRTMGSRYGAHPYTYHFFLLA